jgi:esterase/lipase
VICFLNARFRVKRYEMKKVHFSTGVLFISTFISSLSFGARYSAVKTEAMDGYPSILEATGENTFQANDRQLEDAQENVAKYVYDEVIGKTKDENRRHELGTGEVKQPYAMFHAAGKKVYGTVIFFHGFTNRPEEMAPLASYLFHGGMNVYNVFLSQHYRLPGSQFWPQLKYRGDVVQQILSKPDAPNLIKQYAEGSQDPNLFPRIQELLAPNFSKEKIDAIYENPDTNSNEFKAVFESGPSYRAWLDDGKARINDVLPLPGPIYLVGLSLGANIVLNLAAEDTTGRIGAVVAHAPYLQDKNEDKRNRIKYLGPLANRNEKGDNNAEYSVASAAAQHALAGNLLKQSNIDRLTKIPTFIVTTKCDDSADYEYTWKFFASLQSAPNADSRHAHHAYEEGDNVGHALTDPRDIRGQRTCSGGGSGNKFYRTLYQESRRFMLEKRVNYDNLRHEFQDENYYKVSF